MAVTFVTKYPTTLKNAAWQKNKSFKDKTKAKTKTGLGQALLDAEAAWKLIKFDKLVAAEQGLQPGTTKPLSEINTTKQQTRNYLEGDAQPVQKAIAALDKAASKARTTAKNTALSATATRAATTLSGQLTAQAKLLRDIKLDDFDVVMARVDESVMQLERSHTELLKAMDSAVDELKDSKTLETWDENKPGQVIENAMNTAQSLSQQTGDKNWTGNYDRWRRLMVSFGATDTKVKNGPPGYVAEEIDGFTNLVQGTLGGMWS